MRTVHRMRSILFVRTEPKEVYDFENAKRVYNKKSNEPLFLSIARGVPERVAFDSECPDGDENKEGEYHEHEFRSKGGIER